jgi:hypothetical protein
MMGWFVMPFTGFELLLYWQIIKDRRSPSGFNEGALYGGSKLNVSALTALTPT